MVAANGLDELDGEVLVPISAIEHCSYCPRQCALIHVEQTFDENQFTIRGQIAHERVDSGVDRTTRGVRSSRSIPLWSDRLRLIGRSDVVELRPDGPYPVEYKVGPRRPDHASLQLCAQALCLEEMLGQDVPRGALYFRAERVRQEVVFDAALRARTLAMIEQVRAQLIGQLVPAAVNDARCPNCSLVNACLPSVVGDRRGAAAYARDLRLPIALQEERAARPRRPRRWSDA